MSSGVPHAYEQHECAECPGHKSEEANNNPRRRFPSPLRWRGVIEDRRIGWRILVFHLGFVSRASLGAYDTVHPIIPAHGQMYAEDPED